MKSIKKILASLFILIIFSLGITSCDLPGSGVPDGITVEILNGDEVTMKPGDVLLIDTNIDGALYKYIRFISGASCISVDEYGVVRAHAPGQAMITVVIGHSSDVIVVRVVADEEQPPLDPSPDPTPTPTPEPEPEPDYQQLYRNMSASEFYANYKPAQSYLDAYWRTYYGFMSGALTVPDQAPTISSYRPMQNGYYIRNSTTLYADDKNTYIVTDSRGNEMFRVYRGGAYITLE